MTKGRIACTAGIGMAALLSGSAYAAPQPDYQPGGVVIQVQGKEMVSVDSNPLKLVHGAESLIGSDTVARLLLDDQTPTSHFTADSTVDQGIYDDPDFNAANFHEKMLLNKKNQRWLAQIAGSLDYDTTRTSEITSFGVTAPSIRHLGISATPEIAFSPNPIERYSLSASALSSNYDSRSFTDYEMYTVSPSYAYNFDPLNTGFLSLQGQRYETKSGPSAHTDSYGPSIGWGHIFNERFSSRLTAGVERSELSSATVANTPSQYDYTFAADLKYAGSQDIANFSASRAQQPFGNGSSALFTSFSVNETHALNERLSINAAAAYRFADYLQETGINLDKEAKGSVGLSYNVIEHLDATASYRYLHQKLTNLSGTVQEHVFLVGLTFTPDTMSW